MRSTERTSEVFDLKPTSRLLLTVILERKLAR